MDNIHNAESAIEAVLFASGSSVSISELARVTGVTETEAALAVERIDARYRGGVELACINGKYQFRTNPAYYEHIKRFLKLPEKRVLTSALAETLAVIVYKQPVTKTQIEEIRGVNADHAVYRLMELGLVHECGRLDAPGRPILLGTTDEFLRRFGISDLKELGSVYQQVKD